MSVLGSQVFGRASMESCVIYATIVTTFWDTIILWDGTLKHNKSIDPYFCSPRSWLVIGALSKIASVSLHDGLIESDRVQFRDCFVI